MFLITVPRFSTVDEPFSFRSLISVTLSPSASSAPLESLTLMSMECPFSETEARASSFSPPVRRSPGEGGCGRRWQRRLPAAVYWNADAPHRLWRRMRGLCPRRETPHPPSLREGTLSHKGRGAETCPKQKSRISEGYV